MADPKRQSGGGKVPVATPNIGSTNMAPFEVALSGCIGARIRLTTTSPNSATIEGTVYTIDPTTNLLALNTSPPPPTPLTSTTNLQPGDYRILPISRISNFMLLSLSPSTSEPQTFTSALPTLHALDIRALQAREAAAVAKLHDHENRRGKGVTKDAQELFDAFHKTLPTRWEGTSIVISDSVIIDSPYSVNDCRRIEGVDGGEHALLRVRKVLAMEREKMDLKNSSSRMNSNVSTAGTRVAIPTSAVPSGGARKGG